MTLTDSQPVSQVSFGTQSLNLYRYLDTVGDGSGTKNAIGDYSSVQTIFRLAPAAGEIFRVSRMLIGIEDANINRTDHYGALGTALTNGIEVRTHNGVATITDLTDNVPIKSNAQWGFTCYDVIPLTLGAGNDTVLVRWTFKRAGQYERLDGDASEELQVLFNDDLTGLANHYFKAQGYIEDTPT